MYEADFSTTLFRIVYSSSTTWVIQKTSPSTLIYNNNNASNSSSSIANATIAETGWVSFSSANNPAPIVSDLPEIETFLRIHETEPFSSLGAYEFEFYVDSDGAHIVSGSRSLPSTAYVTFKGTWDGPYTDTATTIPYEWLDYASHSAYADFLQGDGQHQEASLARGVAQNFLDNDLLRVDKLRATQLLAKRIKTHNATQART
jgi:hypothetical protein